MMDALLIGDDILFVISAVHHINHMMLLRLVKVPPFVGIIQGRVLGCTQVGGVGHLFTFPSLLTLAMVWPSTQNSRLQVPLILSPKNTTDFALLVTPQHPEWLLMQDGESDSCEHIAISHVYMVDCPKAPRQLLDFKATVSFSNQTMESLRKTLNQPHCKKLLHSQKNARL